jgi:hypothetical protein
LRASLFLLVYAYWPDDISHKPFASLTLSDVFGTVAAVGITFVLIRALFEPSDEDDIKDAWGWLGVVIARAGGRCGVLFFVVTLNRRSLHSGSRSRARDAKTAERTVRSIPAPLERRAAPSDPQQWRG